MTLSGCESGSESSKRLLQRNKIPLFTSGIALVMRVKDGCFGGVIAMDVRGVGLKALGNGSLYIYNFRK